MNLIYFICRSIHLLGVVVWLGGLLFQLFVAIPVVRSIGGNNYDIQKKLNKHFSKFVWISILSTLITGIILMALRPNFVWFQFNDNWSVLLGFKQLTFILMVVFLYGMTRMTKYLDSPSSNGGFDERVEMYRYRINQFWTMNIILGILAIFFATAMMIYA